MIQRFGNFTGDFEKALAREQTLEKVLQLGGRTILEQKFSAQDLLLISDSTFPSSSSFWGDHLLRKNIRPDRQINKPITIPTVIVVRRLDSIADLGYLESTVFSSFTEPILIFFSSDGNDVKIGCFACDFKLFQKRLLYELALEDIPKHEMLCFHDLLKFWESLHNSIRSKDNHHHPDLNTRNCLKLSNHKLNPISDAESCEILETFVEIKNCSLELCGANRFHLWLTSPIPFNYFVEILPFGQQQISFSFLLRLPKIDYFDAKLTAFLLPFTITIWLFIGITILATSAWLIHTEKKSSGQVIFWQCEVLLVQGGDLLRWIRRRWGKMIMTIWIFTTLFLRNFYNSSLYSFMAKEKEANDFPRSMEELLGQDDVPLLAPTSFLNELHWIYRRETDIDIKLALGLAKFYTKLVDKSFFLLERKYIQSLQQASNASFINTWYFTVIRNQTENNRGIPDAIRNSEEKRFTQFAAMCEGDCEMSLKGVFLGETMLNNRIIVPKQIPFFRTFKFWFAFPSFASLSFSKFLGYFVQSGLHDLATSRYKMLKQLQLLESLNCGRKLGMSNGSLFSYLFLSKNEGEVCESNTKEHAPAKVSEFVGSFIVVGCLFGLALVILIYEVREINMSGCG
ncbi:unnamed protein product [Orchesella dallaii]|uniref:Ionotropic glutamate receptor C-terminal domain-containing protein n=1 Tax=Orchesella dallaii TaxID=48710 RepID=A0ABP1Q8J0_9HEXA